MDHLGGVKAPFYKGFVRVGSGGYACKYGGGQPCANRKNATGWGCIFACLKRFTAPKIALLFLLIKRKAIITNSFSIN